MNEPEKCFPHADGVALREYFEARLESLREQINVKLEATEKATNLARTTIDDRLTAMNEFRAALSDTTARMVTRTELAAEINNLKVEIGYLREFKALMEGKASQTSVVIAYIVTIVSLLLSIYGVIK
jgi:hypothetical protein